MHDRPMRAHASKEGSARQQGESVQKIHRTPDSYNDRSGRRGRGACCCRHRRRHFVSTVGLAMARTRAMRLPRYGRHHVDGSEMHPALIGSCGRLPSTATTVDMIRAMNSTHPLRVLSRVPARELPTQQF